VVTLKLAPLNLLYKSTGSMFSGEYISITMIETAWCLHLFSVEGHIGSLTLQTNGKVIGQSTQEIDKRYHMILLIVNPSKILFFSSTFLTFYFRWLFDQKAVEAQISHIDIDAPAVVNATKITNVMKVESNNLWLMCDPLLLEFFSFTTQSPAFGKENTSQLNDPLVDSLV
jgi:hypothetical protein